MNTKKGSPAKDMTPGEEFKKAHGYSRTMAALMRKYNCSTVDQYREIRKENRKKNRKVKVVKEKPAPVAKQKGGKK